MVYLKFYVLCILYTGTCILRLLELFQSPQYNLNFLSFQAYVFLLCRTNPELMPSSMPPKSAYMISYAVTSSSSTVLNFCPKTC
jgi:hypothetical protein